MGYKKYFKRYMERVSTSLYIDLALFSFKLRGKKTERIATKSSDICIEGFPRSANSYTVVAFRQSSKKELKVATHMHSHANILRAIKLNIPTLVLIRRPEDAVASLRALVIETAYYEKKKVDLVSVAYHLNWYIAFYSSLLNKRDKFVTGKFETVVSNFGQIIDDFNSKFGTDFQHIDNIEEVVKGSSDKLGYHFFPTEKRTEIKMKIKQELQQEEVQDLLKKANKLYEEFIS